MSTYPRTHTHTHTHTHCHIPTKLDPARFHITTFQREPLPSLVIKSTTTGLPATSIAWTKGSTELVNSEPYQVTQLLSDRSTSTYSNLLTINQTLQEARGYYTFTARSEQTGTIQLGTGPNVTVGKGCICCYLCMVARLYAIR